MIIIVILVDVGFNFVDFNVLLFKEVLYFVLIDIDGCFVCFGGNIMLIGRMISGFFIFDFYFRFFDGFCNVNGKSLRFLF